MKILLLVCSMLSFASHAGDWDIWKSQQRHWFGNPGDQAKLTLTSQKYSFAGLEDKRRELNLDWRLSPRFALDASLLMRRHEVEGGMCQFRLNSAALEMMPVIQLTPSSTVGVGVRRYLSGDLNVGNAINLVLEQGEGVFVSARTAQVWGDDHLELRLSSTRLQADQDSLVNPQQEFTNHALKLTYRARF